MSTWEPPTLAKVAMTAVWVGGAAFSAGFWIAGTVYNRLVRRRT